jgi:hypothetical protein
MITWRVEVIKGRKIERLGVIEAPDQRNAYLQAIKTFDVPIERQNRLFVAKLSDRDDGFDRWRLRRRQLWLSYHLTY